MTLLEFSTEYALVGPDAADPMIYWRKTKIPGPREHGKICNGSKWWRVNGNRVRWGFRERNFIMVFISMGSSMSKGQEDGQETICRTNLCKIRRF